MKRIHRTLLTAVVALGLGGGAALYAYLGDARHADERERAADEAKRLFKLDPASVSSAVLHTRGATITFARDELWGWKITSPVDGPADPTAVDALVDRVSQIRAEQLDTGEVTPAVLAKYELTHPKTRLELDGHEGKKRLYVGPKNALDGRYFVTDGDQKAIYLADPAFYWALDRNLDAYREPRIFPVAQSQVVAMRMSSPTGMVWEVRRGPSALPSSERGGRPDAGAGKAPNEAAGWLLVEKEGAAPVAADEGEVNFLLVLFTNRLRIEHWLTDQVDPNSPESLAAWGFKPFERALDLELTGGRHLVGRFGWYRETASDKVTPVMWIEGTRTVVEAPAWARKDLDKTAEELRDRLLSRYDIAEARKMELTLQPGVTVTVQRTGPEAPWTIPPKGTLAATSAVEPFLRVASRLRAAKIEKEHPTIEDQQRYGLVPPRQRILIEDGAGKVLTDLRLGQDANENELWVMSADRDRVGRYAKKLRTIIPTTPEDLLDPKAKDAGPR